ncbi:MAG: hypothetical protein HY552_00460 [Elusimicrobia bacterium]|nr:hypothetical protein [Elusimicrobiota bacterium]
MSPNLFFPALAAGIFGTGAYRYSLVLDVLQHLRTPGITVFTALLFLPPLSARVWANHVTGRRRSWLAIFCGILFAGAALGVRPKPWLSLMGQALLLGMMELLLIPAAQAWSAWRSEDGLAWANSAIFLVSCLSLLLAPMIVSSLGVNRVSIVGAAGYCLLCVLFLNLPESAPTPTNLPQFETASDGANFHGGGVLFLAGAAFGALSNMIYPTALKMLDGRALTVGLASSAPLLSAAGGSWLRGHVGGKVSNKMFGLWMLIPIGFLVLSGPSILLGIFVWGGLLGFIETNCLYAQRELQRAMSVKYAGIASGILLSGLIMQWPAMNPLGAIACSFYVVALTQGVIWKAC